MPRKVGRSCHVLGRLSRVDLTELYDEAAAAGAMETLVMKFIRLLVPILALMATLSATAHAQDASLSANLVSASSAVYPEARAIVNIEDRSGELPPLDASNFTVDAQGAPLRVISAELANSEEAPLDLTLTIDTSGSMAGEAIASTKIAARALVDALSPSDRVSVVGFGDVVTVIQDYTADRALVYAAIDGLVAEGNTALFQATAVSAVHVTSSTASRRAIVLLSDGADFGGRSVATRDEALAAATGVGVPYFTIAQGTDLDRPFLVQLAETTKGRFLEAPQPQDLQALYAEVGRLLKSQYIVTFDASSIATVAESPLSVMVTAGGRTAAAQTMFRPTADFAPALSLSGVIEGDAVSEPRQVLVAVPSAPFGTTVTWFLDDERVAVSDAAPYLYSFDPVAFDNGAHTLRAVVGGAAAPAELKVGFSSAPLILPSKSGPNMTFILMGVGAVVGALIAFMMLKRVRSRRPAAKIDPNQRLTPWAKQVENARRAAGGEGTTEPLPPVIAPAVESPQEDVGEPLGVLISRAGTDLGREYIVGSQPVSIGSSPVCGVRVDDPDLGMEEARVWVREGHMMVHKVSRLSMEPDPEDIGGWAILEPGDTFPIGNHMFEFRLVGERADAGDAAPGAVADGEASAPALEPRAQAEPQRPRMSELMPKNDGGFMGTAE